MKITLQALLESGQPVVADGAMGTMLFSLGLEQGHSPELWNVEAPDNIRKVYRGYIEAGAQVILTNSFGGSRFRLDMHGLGSRATELNRAAAALARQEVDAVDRPVVVAGSMGPTGQLLAPYGLMTMADATEAFAEQAGALVEGGADVLWIETMSSLEEVQAAVAGCQEAAPGFPLVTTMTFDTNGRTMMGVSPEQAIEALGKLDVIALGGNCGNGPDELEVVIKKMREVNPDAVLIAKANAGVPHMEGGVPVYDATPEVMADFALKLHSAGAQIIGACCGSNPDHIRAIADALHAK
jgi:methionine synthase I (cobalamin-dependent)